MLLSIAVLWARQMLHKTHCSFSPYVVVKNRVNNKGINCDSSSSRKDKCYIYNIKTILRKKILANLKTILKIWRYGTIDGRL